MEQRMDQMLQNFNMPGMMGMGHPSIMGAQPGQSSGRVQHRSSHQHQQMMPFGGITGGMFESMFGNMNAMMQQMQNDPNTHSFQSSSSRVVSFSSNGNGPPKYYEASSSTTHGPGGVRQTRKTERNSQTGVDRMAIGHHIYDRGHVVERSRNRRTNDTEENQEFLNIDEEEREKFHEEWQRKSRSHHHAGGGGGRDISYNDQNNYRRPQHRAINSAEYHRANMERDRDRHTDRHRERHDDRHRGDGRRVQINSRPEQI